MSKGTMIIDGLNVEFDGEKNVLAVIRKAGIEVPTFCYSPELSIFGACRLCVVENEWGGIDASCSMQPRDGMVIKTNTPRLRKYRKNILELLLAAHCRDCTTCDKNGKCKLQEYCTQYGVNRVRFQDTREILPLDTTSPSIVRDPNKCILCGACVRVCEELQGEGIIDFAYRGSNLRVIPAFGRTLDKTDCIGCGQCAAICPVGAITIKQDTDKVWDDLADSKKEVVAQVAPAVRVALGEEFGIPVGENVMGKLVTALKRVGFDKVYDTTFSADMTTIEEAREFLDRVKNGGKFPMFTSCCPGWINYVQTRAPQYLDHISTCKSPQQMFGSALKELWNRHPVEGKTLVSVSIMPCTAKKYEAARPEFTHDGVKEVDHVLTTQEIASMIKTAGIDLKNLPETEPDAPMGMGSGAAVIFGVTGGVAEAVLRYVMPDEIQAIEFSGVRGMDHVKSCEVKVGDKTIKLAVVHGLKNAQDLIAKMESGELYYDLVEVMACPGGCVGGAGQPTAKSFADKEARGKGLYNTDAKQELRLSTKNTQLAEMYEEFLDSMNHELLHVHYPHL